LFAGGYPANEDLLKLAMGAVAIPAMLQSSARAGAIVNVTVAEFQRGREQDGVYVVSVLEHKTNVQGTCKLMFDKARAKQYHTSIRPATILKGDSQLLRTPTIQTHR
jgi:hypothetical protein